MKLQIVLITFTCFVLFFVLVGILVKNSETFPENEAVQRRTAYPTTPTDEVLYPLASPTLVNISTESGLFQILPSVIISSQ